MEDLGARIRAACSGIAAPRPGLGCLRVPTLRINDSALYYERAGIRGDVPVVFLHGGLIDSRVWNAQFARFSERADVIRFDLPGNGRSDPTHGAFSGFETLAAAFSALDVERAHFVGLSGGARIAIDFAIRYPERVEKLVAVAPGISGYERWSLPRERVAPFLTALKDGDRDAAAGAWLDIWAPVTKERLLDLGRDNAESLFTQEALKELAPPAIDRLSELTAPTLVIVGDRDVRDIQTIVELIIREAPFAQKRVFEGADHFPNVYDEASFNAVVASFLSLSR